MSTVKKAGKIKSNLNSQKTDSKCKFVLGANSVTANWINEQHKKLEIREQQLVNQATSIGAILFKVQEKCKHGTFGEWLKNNVCFSVQTAYKYISLFNYKEHISGSKNLTEAYKKVAVIMQKERQAENKKAEKRIAEYKKTGKKPEGWRQKTDDKLAAKKEESPVIKKPEKKETKNAAESVNKKQGVSVAYDKRLLIDRIKDHEKNAPVEQLDDSFNDILMDYLGGFTNNSRKIIACQNIIKMCRKVIDNLW